MLIVWRVIMLKNSATSKKMPKKDFLGIFIENVDCTFMFCQHFITEQNSMKNEILNNEQVWRLHQDNHCLSLGAYSITFL